jgi:hypothetical protein
MGEILWRVTVQGFALTIFRVLLQDGSGGGRAGGGRRLRKRRRATWSEEGSEGEDADGEEVRSCAGVLGTKSIWLPGAQEHCIDDLDD